MTHYKIQARGRLGVVSGTGVEEWSCTTGLVDSAGDSGYAPVTSANMQVFVDECMDAWKALISNTTAVFPTETYVDEVRVYAYNPGVRLSQSIAYSTEAATPIPPGKGSGGINHPPQCAIAVGLEAAGLRAKPKRGRFYLPMISQSVGSDLRLPASYAAAVRDQAKTLLLQIEAAAGDATIAGAKSAILSQDGLHSSPVAVVRVGQVVDTMRSRRRSLLENYQEVSLH